MTPHICQLIFCEKNSEPDRYPPWIFPSPLELRSPLNPWIWADPRPEIVKSPFFQRGGWSYVNQGAALSTGAGLKAWAWWIGGAEVGAGAWRRSLCLVWGWAEHSGAWCKRWGMVQGLDLGSGWNCNLIDYILAMPQGWKRGYTKLLS